MAVVTSFIRSMVAVMDCSAHRLLGGAGCRCLRGDLLGGLARLCREVLHLARNHGEALARITRTRRLDGGIESEQVGLPRDIADQPHDIPILVAAWASPCTVPSIARASSAASAPPRRPRPPGVISATLAAAHRHWPPRPTHRRPPGRRSFCHRLGLPAPKVAAAAESMSAECCIWPAA